jgi:hypothetical protein
LEAGTSNVQSADEMWEYIKNVEYQLSNTLVLILFLLPMVFSVDIISFYYSITQPYRKGCLRMAPAAILSFGFIRSISLIRSIACGSMVL